MITKNRKWTDKKLRSMERNISDIYAQSQEELIEKWNAYMARTEKRLEKLEQAYSEAVKKNDKDLIAEAKEKLVNAKKNYTLRDEHYKAMVKSVTKDMYEINQRAVAYSNNQLPQIYIKNYDEFQDIVGSSFILPNEATIKRMILDGDIKLPNKKINFAKDVAWNTKKLNSAVLQGIIQGESMNDIAKRILPIVNGNKSAAMRNARTMVTSAENKGRIDSYFNLQDKGLIMEKQWLATGDSRTREWHLFMDGQHVPLDEKFIDGNGNELEYPCDPDAEPETVYNCRCRIISYIAGFKNALGEEIYFNNESENFSAHEEEIIKEQIRRISEYNQSNSQISIVEPQEFKKNFDVAKSTIAKGAEWRVDDTHKVKEYKNDKLIVFNGGSTIAVTPKGDIISVCKNMNGAERGSDLLRIAVKNGGDRLDAFGDGLYSFYTKNGFEPVSWTKFNVEYAPHDWVKGRDNEEPVIFYRYTGKFTDISYDDFLAKTKPFDEYDDAMKHRDKLIAKKRKK